MLRAYSKTEEFNIHNLRELLNMSLKNCNARYELNSSLRNEEKKEAEREYCLVIEYTANDTLIRIPAWGNIYQMNAIANALLAGITIGVKYSREMLSDVNFQETSIAQNSAAIREN